MNPEKNILNLANQVQKYCLAMEGNVSAKTKTGLLIKASGSKLSHLTKDDLIYYDNYGKQLSNLNKIGSIEIGFHTYLLSLDNINYVSHTHPINTNKILCTEYSKIFAENRLFPEQVIFNGVKSCLVPYAKPGDDLLNLIKEYVEIFRLNEGHFPKLILLQNHGIIACGATVDECVIITEICEKAAEIFLGASLLGNIKFLSNDQTIDLINDKKEKYRQNLLK